MEAGRFVSGRSEKKRGAGKNTHSVLDEVEPRPKCISNPNRAKLLKIRSNSSFMSSLVLNIKAPSSNISLDNFNGR